MLQFLLNVALILGFALIFCCADDSCKGMDFKCPLKTEYAMCRCKDGIGYFVTDGSKAPKIYSYEDSEKMCKDYKMQLASLKTKDDVKFVNDMLTNVPKKSIFFVGVQYKVKDQKDYYSVISGKWADGKDVDTGKDYLGKVSPVTKLPKLNVKKTFCAVTDKDNMKDGKYTWTPKECNIAYSVPTIVCSKVVKKN